MHSLLIDYRSPNECSCLTKKYLLPISSSPSAAKFSLSIPVINYVTDYVPFHTTLTPSVRCRCVARRLFLMAPSKVAFTPLHFAIVRPHLDYVMEANSLYLIADINHLERVQCLVTLLVRGLRLVSFEERPRSLNCLSYELMRLRVDLILVFKISKAGINLSPCTFFPSSTPTWVQ